MVNERRRYPRDDALQVAERLRALLAPACERIEVAGSIRRNKPDVGDIELLCIPRYDLAVGFFGDGVRTDCLSSLILTLITQDKLRYRLNSKGSSTFGPLNKLLIDVASGIPLDVFCTDARNWGMALVVRTGPAEFNVRMMTRFRQQAMAGHAYAGVRAANGEELDCPDEATVFRLLGWQYAPPEERT